MNLKWILCSVGFLIYVLHIAVASSMSSVFTEERVSQLATELTSNCDPSVCHSTDVVELITHGSLSQYDQVMHVLNEKGPLCLRFALEALKDKLEKQVHINCGNLVGEAKKNCQDAQIGSVIVNNRILSLVNLMVSKRTNLARPFAQQLLEDKTSSTYTNSRVLELLQRLEDERSCDEYEIGEEREFIITPFQSTILPYTYYRVKRESEKHYKAFVALEFSLEPFYDGVLLVNTVDQVHGYYMNKVRSCISYVNPKMKGPYGEILEIVIEDAHQVDSCRTKHSIQVGGPHIFQTAKYYHINIDDRAITHEILHVLGLWDEYIQIYHAPEDLPDHECRVVQENSLLLASRDGKIRWDRVFETELEDSLLDPSHFQSILYGNCFLRDDVKLYRRCSRLSYQILSDENACLAEKNYCDRQNVLGRDKLVERQRINDEIQNLQAELNAISVWLSDNPDLLRSDPEYSQREAHRSKRLRRKEEIQERMPYLQTRLEFVLSWPDSSTSSP